MFFGHKVFNVTYLHRLNTTEYDQTRVLHIHAGIRKHVGYELHTCGYTEIDADVGYGLQGYAEAVSSNVDYRAVQT